MPRKRHLALKLLPFAVLSVLSIAIGVVSAVLGVFDAQNHEKTIDIAPDKTTPDIITYRPVNTTLRPVLVRLWWNRPLLIATTVSLCAIVAIVALALTLTLVYKTSPLPDPEPSPIEKDDDAIVVDDYWDSAMVVGGVFLGMAFLVVVYISVLKCNHGSTLQYSSKDLDWDALFDAEGRLMVSKKLAMQTIQTTRIPSDKIGEVWVRLLGIRGWNITDQEFACTVTELDKEYAELVSREGVVISKQVKLDVPRADYPNHDNMEAFLRAFEAKYPGYEYCQSFNFFAAACLEVFSPEATSLEQMSADIGDGEKKSILNKRTQSGLAFAVFEAMLEKYWRRLFEDRFKYAIKMAIDITLKLVRQHNRSLYDSIIAGNGLGSEEDFGQILTVYTVLWGRNVTLKSGHPNNIYSKISAKSKHALPRSNPEFYSELHAVLSMWMNMLAYPDPNKAIHTLMAAIMLTNEDRFMDADAVVFHTLMQASKNPKPFNLEESLDLCLKIYQ